MATWPTATVINTFYYLMTEHADAEKRDELDALLDEPLIRSTPKPGDITRDQALATLKGLITGGAAG